MAGYRRWRGRDGLGLGDVKLAAVAGSWLGLATVFAVVELAALSALGAYVASGLSAQPSAQGDGLPSLRAVPGAGNLDRLAGRGAAELEAPTIWIGPSDRHSVHSTVHGRAWTKNAKTTPCKVTLIPARSARAALRPGRENKNAPSSRPQPNLIPLQTASQRSRLGAHSSARSRACAISPRVILPATASRMRTRASRARGGAAATARLSHLLASTISRGTPCPRS